MPQDIATDDGWGKPLLSGTHGSLPFRCCHSCCSAAAPALLAYMMEKRGVAAALETKKAEAETKVAPAEEPISAALKIDDLKIELGYSLLPLVNSPDGTDRLTEQIKALRRSLAAEMPAVRILDNV